MTDKYSDDAWRFVASLPENLKPAEEAPSISEVRSKRSEEFPVLAAGVAAINKAIHERFGIDYSVQTRWGRGAVNMETRAAGVDSGDIVVTRPGKAEVKIPFDVAPNMLTLGGVPFSPDEDGQIQVKLHALLSEALQS